jgi:hypothetical protein
MRTPSDRDLARHREAIHRFLRRHRDAAPVQWAVAVVERELFGYHGAYGFSYELWTEQRFGALKDAGATPMEVLQRVIECYALRRDDSDRTFPSANAFSAFLARKVLRLRRGVLLANSNAARLITCGCEIEHQLGRFTLATLMRMEQEREVRAATDRELNAWAMA